MKDVWELIFGFMKEPSVLIGVVLYIIGWLILKPTKKIPDELIPVILMGLGILFALGVYVIGDKAETTNVVLQGILATGFAIGLNQGQKQLFTLRDKLKK